MTIRGEAQYIRRRMTEIRKRSGSWTFAVLWGPSTGILPEGLRVFEAREVRDKNYAEDPRNWIGVFPFDVSDQDLIDDLEAFHSERDG